MQPIAFNGVALAARKNKKAILQSVSSVIESGIFLNGKEKLIFEKNCLRFLGQNGYFTAVSSGHDAIFLALSYLNLTSEDEVIIPVNSYPTAFPVFLTRARVVLTDVDINAQMTLENIKKKISQNTKAIILVHLYGLVGNFEEIIDFAKKKKIFIIEDCAQALGSSYKGQMLGTFGDIGCFSFYPTKNVSTLGDGGGIWTKNKKISQFIKKAASYGEDKQYHSLFISGHFRIGEIQAGIMNSLFPKINHYFTLRKALYSYYQHKLIKQTYLLKSHPQSEPVPHLLVIITKKRNQLKQYLADKGIPTAIHYPKPIHLVPAFSALGYKKGDFPIAEDLSQTILSLPFHPFLSKTEVDRIIREIKNFYYGRKNS